MCVLALWLGLDQNMPLVVGANRDESYSRLSAPPSEIEPGIFAGKDLEKGGTWLGLNRHGLFVALTNRRVPAPASGAPSRGVMVLEALRCRNLASVEAIVRRRVGDDAYAGFNLVAAVDGEGLCLHYDGSLRRTPFGPGIHVISSDRDLDDAGLPEKLALDRFVAVHPGLPDEVSLPTFLASHEGERPVCKHGDGYGTVSSTIVVVGAGGSRLLHAGGPPCRTPFTSKCSLLAGRVDDP
jgi:uncharacterized protein with NRDE domain